MTLTATTVDTDGAVLGLVASLSIAAVGGAIGPAYKAVIYDDAAANDTPLWFVDFGGVQTAAEGTNFLFQVPDGLLDIRDA